jgi:hypothetical protein
MKIAPKNAGTYFFIFFHLKNYDGDQIRYFSPKKI